MYADFAQVLIREARKLYANEEAASKLIMYSYNNGGTSDIISIVNSKGTFLSRDYLK